MKVRRVNLLTLLALTAFSLIITITGPSSADDSSLNQELKSVLDRFGFTGRIEANLEKRLGRPVDEKLADIGGLLWFDTITGLNDDNTMFAM